MKHALKDMTAAEFRDRLAGDPCILLPLGSQEVQGPHAPMGDYQLAEAVALEAARLSGAIAAPCLPFGYAEFFRGFPGGMQLRAATFTAVLGDMLGAFLDHGITRLLVLNGHTTNAPLVDQVQRRLRRETGVAVASLDLWRAIPDAVWAQAHGADAARARGHGGDPLTSLGLYLFPEQARPDLIRPSAPARALGLPATVSGATFEGAALHVPLNAEEINAEGMLGGDARLASAEAGRVFFDHLTEKVARLVAHLARTDPRDPMAGMAEA